MKVSETLRLTDEAFFAVEIAVRSERERAHAKHGAKGNSREDQPWDEREWLPILVEEVGEVAHLLTYDTSADPRDLRKELVQVAAMATAWIAAIDEFTGHKLQPCEARIWHGPGHQSSTRCEVRGSHEEHRAVYGEFNQYARWRTRADGKHTFTGAFDEPPQGDDE